MALTGNKGEWSEVYTLLKVISDKKLYSGNDELEKVNDVVYPIIKILRDESNLTNEFSYKYDLVLIKSIHGEITLPLSIFKEKSGLLLKRLKENKKSSFAIPEIESFMNSMNCSSIKAKSSLKSDIRIIIHDYRTGLNPELGFSIKSQLGGASTLLNASKSTNFIYKIKNLNQPYRNVESINSINSIRKIRDRLELINKNSDGLIFYKTENSVFGDNLRLIDSSLPSIIAEMLYQFYSSTSSKTNDLVEVVRSINPLKFNDKSSHPFYAYKLKKLLIDIALGMMPSKVWTGQLDATGGYLIVKEDGEIVCFHIYNRNDFEDYLCLNTKFEMASSKRHGFGYVYSSKEDYFIKLNLQIRFLK